MTDVHYHVWLFVGSGDLNLVPHATSTLPTELSPQPAFLIFIRRNFIGQGKKCSALI